MADILTLESFDTIDLETARTLVGAQIGPKELSNWKFYNDDHWQSGDAWTGPKVGAGSDGVAKTVLEEIERQFTYSNVSRELVDHHCDAVIANPPQWGSVFTTPLPEPAEGKEKGERTPEQLTQQGELDEFLRAWSDDSMRGLYLDRNGITRTCTVFKLLQRAARMYAATGRANLRLFIPPKKRDENGQLKPVPFKESLNRLYVELLEPGLGALYPDRDRMQAIGVTVYKLGDKEFAEFSYLDDTGNTILRQVSSEKDSQEVRVPLLMDGRLWLFEMCDDPVLLGSILSQQKSINKTLTMGDRNQNLAGFPERVMRDVQSPGKYEIDPTADGGKRFIPEPFLVGAGAVLDLKGIKITDPETGKVTRATPGYDRLPAQGNDVFDGAARSARGRMLDQAAQTYVEMEGDGQASGKSRETARQRFRNSIGSTVGAVTSAGLWLYNVALSVARETSSEKTKYADLRVDFKCQVDLGALSSVERTEDRAQVAAGQMSRETAMTRGGTEDVDAENGRIASENATSLAIIEQRAKAMQFLTAAGASVGAAARVVGFNEEQVALLEQSDFTSGEDNENEDEDQSGEVDAGALRAGIEASKGLNGAQINAALSVFDRLSDTGEGVKITPFVATELLVLVGTPREIAQEMVNKSKKTGG